MSTSSTSQSSRVVEAGSWGGCSSGRMNHKVAAVGQHFVGGRERALGNRLQGLPIVYLFDCVSLSRGAWALQELGQP